MNTPSPEPTNAELIAAWMQDELADMTRTAHYCLWRCGADFKSDSVSAYYRSVAIDHQDSAALQWRRTRAYIDRECA